MTSSIELTELHRIARNAEGLLGPLASAPAEVWVPRLKPRDDDYSAVFAADAAERARAGYAALWQTPPATLGRRGDAIARAFGAQADALGHDNDFAREFPGGYRAIAARLMPDRVWLVWRYLAAGDEGGVRYDGLVYLGDHWAWFPKPWRVLGSQE
jgi:hypothetical protein